MGLAYRLVRPQPTYMDVAAMRGNKDYRFTTSPFGITPEQYEKNPPLYVGASVPWKTIKGAKFFKDAVGLCSTVEKGARLVAGLRAAIAISKKYAGIKGTVIYNGKLYPKKCIEQKKG